MISIGPLQFKDALSGRMLKAFYLDGDQILCIDMSAKGSNWCLYDIRLNAIVGNRERRTNEVFHGMESLDATLILRVLLDPRVTADQAHKSLMLSYDLRMFKLRRRYGAGWHIVESRTEEHVRLEDMISYLVR